MVKAWAYILIMRGIAAAVALVACIAVVPDQATGFAPTPPIRSSTKKNVQFPISPPLDITATSVGERRQLISVNVLNDGIDESNDAPGFRINPPYALAYVLFLGFAYIRQSAEVEGASMEALNQYIADPLNPGWNELFITIFNLLGLYAAPLACLLMPGSKNQKLPAAPFVLGSMFGGYGALGIYTSTREPNPTEVSKSDLGWFTANVLENKLFNYFILLLCASTYVTSGALGAFVSDPVGLIKGYGDMFSETALVSASSVDFVILTLTAAALVPEDLSRRGYKGDIAPELIAASTVLLPGLGAALYCALRPSLEEE